MDLGSKIKNLRYNHNMSQETLAKILKINRNYLSRIETNKSLPTSEILADLATQFKISIDTLLEVNKEEKDTLEVKKIKLKKISQLCVRLSNKELDFIYNILCIMTNNITKASFKDSNNTKN